MPPLETSDPGPSRHSSGVLSPDEPDLMTSRHEPQVLGARIAPADPYLEWSRRREVERMTSAVAGARRAARLMSHRPKKAPWEAILVKLSSDV